MDPNRPPQDPNAPKRPPPDPNRPPPDPNAPNREASDRSAPERIVSDRSAREQAAPYLSVPDQHPSDQLSPDRLAPERFASDRSVREQPASYSSAPDRPPSERPSPDRLAPERFASDRSAPNSSAPDRPPSDRPSPDRLAPEQFASDRSAREQPAPYSSAPDRPPSDRPSPDRLPPERFAPDRSAREQPAPYRSAPDRPPSDQPSPNRLAPERIASDHSAREQSLPEQIAPYRPAPERSAPDRSAPERYSPDRSALPRSSLDRSAPGRSSPDRFAPPGSSLDRSAPGRSRPPTHSVPKKLPALPPPGPPGPSRETGAYDSEQEESWLKCLYNSRTGEFCYRTPTSWMLILSYSAMYLIFLMTFTLIILYISLTIIKQTVDFNAFDTSIERPIYEYLTYSDPGIGLTALPTSEDNVPLIWYKHGEKDGYDKYVKAIDKFLLSNRRKREVSSLGPCGQSPYGYGEKPCIILRINKKFNWAGKPLNFNSTIAKSAPSEVQAWMRADKTKLWLHCSGFHSYDKEHIGKITYYPDPPGFDASQFPLDAHKQSPLVAVQISEFTIGISLAIECKLWFDAGPSTVEFVLYVAPESKVTLRSVNA